MTSRKLFWLARNIRMALAVECNLKTLSTTSLTCWIAAWSSLVNFWSPLWECYWRIWLLLLLLLFYLKRSYCYSLTYEGNIHRTNNRWLGKYNWVIYQVHVIALFSTRGYSCSCHSLPPGTRLMHYGWWSSGWSSNCMLRVLSWPWGLLPPSTYVIYCHRLQLG